LQKQLGRRMLGRLHIQPSTEEAGRIEKDSNTDINAYRRLLETEGVVDERTPTPDATVPPTPEPHARVNRHDWQLAPWVRTAHAAEPPAEVTAAVRQTVEEFRAALERKDFTRLESLYVSFSKKHRAVLEAYLRNADQLTIEFTDIALEIRPAGVLV